MKPKPKATPEHFWAGVDTSAGPDACWPWTRAVGTWGYGRSFMFGRNWGAHQVAYQLTVGPIPPGHLICHHCDNPPCCNPAHLYAGTPADNMRDRSLRGRALWRNCKRGHPFDAENTLYTARRGGKERRCRTCFREREALSRATRKVVS